MSKTTFEKSCDNIYDLIKNWSDSEKKFALWKLLRYYQEGLQDDLKFKPKDEDDLVLQTKMKTHIHICDEIVEEIRKEIW